MRFQRSSLVLILIAFAAGYILGNPAYREKFKAWWNSR